MAFRDVGTMQNNVESVAFLNITHRPAPHTAHTKETRVWMYRCNHGRCPVCGNRTHKRSAKKLGQWEALNIPGIVMCGVCIHPHCPQVKSNIDQQQYQCANATNDMNTIVPPPNQYDDLMVMVESNRAEMKEMIEDMLAAHEEAEKERRAAWLQDSLCQLRRVVEDVESQESYDKASLDSQMNDIRSDLVKCRGLLDSLQQDVSMAMAAIAGLEQWQREMSVRMTNCETRVKAVEDVQTEMTDNNDQVNDRVVQLEAELRRLRSQIELQQQPPATVELSENDSINTILTAMRDNRGIASVQERGCALLGRLSQFDENKRTEIGSAGGIVRILDGMEQHPRDEAVQRHGCFALRYSVVCNDDNPRRIAQTRGGIETILKAMNNHGSDELLLEHACSALAGLSCCYKEENRKEANK